MSPEAHKNADDMLHQELKMTPAMIEAGIRAYWEWECSEDWRVESLVTTLFRLARSLEGVQHNQPTPRCVPPNGCVKAIIALKMSSDAYDPYCPDCGHMFSLADLRRMAVGDGWQRHLWVRLADGSEKIVAFDEFDPRTMTDITPPRLLPD